MRSNKLRRNHRKPRRFTKKRKTRQSGGTLHPITYPPDSINTYITSVVYINLDKRTDRRAQMEQELKIFHPEKIHRILGIVPDILDIAHKNVALTKAHLNAVKLAKKNNWLEGVIEKIGIKIILVWKYNLLRKINPSFLQQV